MTDPFKIPDHYSHRKGLKTLDTIVVLIIFLALTAWIAYCSK
jgi:hypothetical protein